MRHGILGPGGIGGLIGAVLADAGEDVRLIVRPGTASQYLNEISLGSWFESVRAEGSVAERVTEPLDVLWVTVKSTQLDSALKHIPNNSQVEHVVPLLNGIDHVDQLRGRFGQERVIPATIAVESERVAPGKIVHRSPFIPVQRTSKWTRTTCTCSSDIRAFRVLNVCSFRMNRL